MYFAIKNGILSNFQEDWFVLVETWVPWSLILCFFPGERGMWLAWFLNFKICATHQQVGSLWLFVKNSFCKMHLKLKYPKKGRCWDELCKSFTKLLSTCRIGNSSVCPKSSWKLASMENTDPSLALWVSVHDLICKFAKYSNFVC